MQNEMRRLRWQCRRGMLELDVLLQRFLEQQYEALPAHEQQIFRDLLHETDQDLFQWVTGVSQPSSQHFQQLIAKVRGHGA